MRSLFLGVSLLALGLVSSAQAASTLAVAGSGGTNIGTAAGTATSHGLGGAVVGAAGVSAGTSAGVAVSTPVGGLSAGVGQTNNFGAAGGLTGGILGGGGSFAGAGAGTGVNVGGGFTNHTP